MYKLLKNGKICQTKLKGITAEAIRGIKKVKKMAKCGPEVKLNNQPEAKLGRREREQQDQHERLMTRIAKIKDDQLQQQFEDENDELISRPIR